LIDSIRTALSSEKAAEGTPGETDGQRGKPTTPPDKTALLRLKEALEAEKVSLADDILKELATQPLDPAIKTQLSVISDHILMFEFKEAIEEIDIWFARSNA
jgi:hypothetical protein